MKTKFFDATLFLGMHASDGALRNASIHFFAAREVLFFTTTDQIGIIDNRIWQLDPVGQQYYFAFMDAFMSQPHVQCVFLHEEIENALPNYTEGTLSQKVLLAAAKYKGAHVYTLDPEFAKTPHVRRPPFPLRPSRFHTDALENLYQASLTHKL